jgi:acetyl esterase/lipase
MSKFNPYDHLKIALNPDGTLTRHLKIPKIEAKPNAAPGDLVVTKDVTLNEENETWVRVFLPTKLPSNARLPIIIYYHHGGWVLLSAADANVHADCARMAIKIPAVVVSVNYRLAPESRLPAQYDDAMDAINWVKQQVANPKGEQWIRDCGDSARLYLYGCGNGANMAFFVSLKAFELQMGLAGIILNQPMFGGERRTESEIELATDEIWPLPVLDLAWKLSLPKGVNRDHRYCNPIIEGPHMADMIRWLGRCLVIGFGEDPMIDRQQEFVTMLVKCGVPVEACFDDVGFHNIHLVDPRRAEVVLNIMREFMI